MLKFTSIVGTYSESFLTIFGQCINVLKIIKCEIWGGGGRASERRGGQVKVLQG